MDKYLVKTSKKRDREEAEKVVEVDASDEGNKKDDEDNDKKTQAKSAEEVKEQLDLVAAASSPVKKQRPSFVFIEEPGWKALLEGELDKAYFKDLMKFVKAEQDAGKKVYPPNEFIFHCFDSCPFEKTRVVIIGQDPYHGPRQAHGLCFSVQKGIPVPPSLVNIYKEAQADVKIPKPTHGCLDSWSEQGVLLLNTVMTVRESEPNSHQKKGWETFTDTVIKTLSLKKKNLVFLLWGKPAQSKIPLIHNHTSHLIIKSSHPSPLGAAKTNEPFLGSKCFSRTNDFLAKHGLEPIDWKVV